MGKPEMYGMDLAFEIDGKVSDKETINFGVREVRDYFTEEGYRGFLLNGKKVLVRSAGWTDDIFCGILLLQMKYRYSMCVI